MLRDYRQFIPHVKSVKWTLIWGIIVGLIYGPARGFGIPYMIQHVVKPLFGEESSNYTHTHVVLLCMMPAAILLLQGLANFFSNYLISVASIRMLENIRNEMFERLQTLPLSFFFRNKPGDLTSRVLGDTGIIQNTLMTVVQTLVKQPVVMVGSLGYLAYLCFTNADVMFLLLFLMAIPICIVPIRIIGKKVRKKSLAMQEQSGEIYDRMSQNMSATQEIRSFCLEQRETNRFKAVCHTFSVRTIKVIKYTSLLSPIIEVVAAAGVGVAIYYAYRSGIGFDTFLPMITALYLCYEPVKKLAALNVAIEGGRASISRVNLVLKEPTGIGDVAQPTPMQNVRGDIAFNNTSFAYGEEVVLKEANASLAAGKTYALVGPSGAGKTTFANMIPRFFDPISGEICIDGIDIRQYPLKDLRRNIALVSQSPFLFHESILENIRIGRPDATMEEVIEATKKASAHEFILNLENGYETLVGENGIRLSGGQKQRIAIARAFLKNAPILILDEPTSALDSNSEMEIQAALEKLFIGKTVLIIAHRFSAIKHAHEILVFQRGRIIATGHHNDLYTSCALYHELFNQQSLEAEASDQTTSD